MIEFSQVAIEVMRAGGILDGETSPDQLIERVLDAVLGVEERLGGTATSTAHLRRRFAEHMSRKLVMLGTPLLTNASRTKKRALGSCVAIPIDLRQPFATLRPAIESYYEQNTGSGFDLNLLDDPVAVVEALDQHAAQLTASKTCERYIGNLANIDIDHSRVRDFVMRKALCPDLRHFNLSVNVGEEFMAALDGDKPFRLRDGTYVPARQLWEEIVHAAWKCGDPGLLFLERYNDDNPTPAVGRYATTAPCAEVGLAPGESCVFGYVNLGGFLDSRPRPAIDFDLLREVVRLLTRVLDDALEFSLDRYPDPATEQVMRAKRRIGIGICGFADLLVRSDVPYDSPAAAQILRDVLTTITFASKQESVELARQRGSFPAFAHSRYALTSDFLTRKYGDAGSCVVSAGEWRALEREIRGTGHLRNASTTALPPSGRTSLLLDASASLEPWFSLYGLDGELKPDILAALRRHSNEQDVDRLASLIGVRGTCQTPEVPPVVRELVKCATELTPSDHLDIAAAAAGCVDDALSKTINLPRHAGTEAIADVFGSAWRCGLKSISVYRDGTVDGQPERLGPDRVS